MKAQNFSFVAFHQFDWEIYGSDNYLSVDAACACYFLTKVSEIRAQHGLEFSNLTTRLSFRPNLCQPDGILSEFSYGFFDEWNRPPALLLCSFSVRDGDVTLQYYLPTDALEAVESAISVDAYGCIEIDK